MKVVRYVTFCLEFDPDLDTDLAEFKRLPVGLVVSEGALTDDYVTTAEEDAEPGAGEE